VYSSQERRYAIPKSLFILNQDKLEEIPYSNNNIDFSVLIFKTQEVYQSILLDQELSSCLLVRLFFMGGRGLEKFKPFIEENNSGQRKSKVNFTINKRKRIFVGAKKPYW